MERLTIEGFDFTTNFVASNLQSYPIAEALKKLQEYEDANELKPIEEWHEDYGDCLFWKLPIDEPPYCGSPLSSDFIEGYYTHFTRLIMPTGIE